MAIAIDLRQPFGSSRLGVALVATLAVVGACRCDDEPIRSGPAAKSIHPAPSPAPAASPTRAVVAPGEMILEVDASRVRLVARDVPRRKIIRGLAMEFGFETEDRSRENPRIVIDADDVSLADALALVLLDEPYTLRYERTADGTTTRLAFLDIGPAAEVPGDPATDGPPRATRDRSAQERRTAEELEQVRAVRRQRRELRRQERVAALESPEGQVRARAIFGLEADEPANRDAFDAAIRDPDVRVRMEAARKLGFGDPASALPILRVALADTEPDVVVAALRSLAFLRASEAASDVEPLLDHESEKVRVEARSALDVLE